MSISMPSYFMFNLRNMDDMYRQTIWDGMAEDEQKLAESEWKALHSGNGSAYDGTGTTTISSTPPEATYNTDTKNLAASRDTTHSANPTTASLTGFNALLAGDTVSGLIFVDVVNANTDANKTAQASAAHDIMTGRYGGSQGVLGVDLNDNGHIDDASELFGTGGGATRAGYVDFTLDPSKLSSGDRIAFSVARALDGAEQTFTLTGETSAAEIATGINQAAADGTLSGVTASVEDGRLRLTATDTATGLADPGGTVTGSLTDETGDVSTTATIVPGNGIDTPGHADYAIAAAGLSAGDQIRFTVDGGTGQSFGVTGETSVDALVAAINQAVADETLSGVVASNEDGVLRLTASEPTGGVTSASLLDKTDDVTTAGAAFLADGMQRLSDYTTTAADGSVTWTSEKKATLLSSSGASSYTDLSLSGMIDSQQATVTTSLDLNLNQGARINVAV